MAPDNEVVVDAGEIEVVAQGLWIEAHIPILWVDGDPRGQARFRELAKRAIVDLDRHRAERRAYLARAIAEVHLELDAAGLVT